MPPTFNKGGFQRRVIGQHGYRLDGLTDLLSRAQGSSVFDVGCNRGMVGYEFALHGATTIHGCDSYVIGIQTANEVFADFQSVQAKFEITDLSKGPSEIERWFGPDLLSHYDFIVYLAVHHKLRRVMDADRLSGLVEWLADHCGCFFVWRGSFEEMNEIEPILLVRGFRRIHLSEISEYVIEWDGIDGEKSIGSPKSVPQPAAIWKRQ